MSTSESRNVNRHTARCTSPVSVVSQCELQCLADDYGNGDQRRCVGLMAREGLYVRTLYGYHYNY